MTDHHRPAAFDEEAWQEIKQRRGNFVAPYGPGERPAPIARRLEPQTPLELGAPMPVQSIQRYDTSHVDRAKGFTIVSIPLAMGVGLGGLLLAAGLFSVPLFSMGALLVFFLTFLGVWLVAFLWHESASPDGVTLWQVLLHYRLLRYEQRARLERMEDE